MLNHDVSLQWAGWWVDWRWLRVRAGGNRRAPRAHQPLFGFTRHHGDADSTVHRAGRVLWIQKNARCQSNHPRQFVVWHAGGHEFAPGRVGSIRRELPVAVTTLGTAVR